MFQFLPFMLGLMTGSVAVRAARSQRARQGLERARASARALEHPIDDLRTAASSSLAAIERGTARLREKIAPPAPVATQDTQAPTRSPRKAAPKAAPAKPGTAKRTPPRARKPAASKAAPAAQSTEKGEA